MTQHLEPTPSRQEIKALVGDIAELMEQQRRVAAQIDSVAKRVNIEPWLLSVALFHCSNADQQPESVTINRHET